MLIVHHELLPEIYLLVLAPDPAAPSEFELAHHLGCAARSGKPAVWVDCRLVATMSATAARLLWACHHRLRQRGAQLVLCRVSATLEQLLRQHCPSGIAPDLHLVDSLDEAVAQLYAHPPTISRPNPMPCSSFLPLPDGLTPGQERAWNQRCQTAGRIIAQQAATTGGPDAEVIIHLQPYVRGEISLGQAIGRLLDYQARH
jgi:hypothetical protein